MKFGFVLVGIGVGVGLVACVAMPVFADEIGDLEAKVKTAEAKLAEVQARITLARGRHAEADAQLQAAVKAKVRLGQYPPGFWLMRSVVMDSPGQAELMQAAARLQGEQVVQAQAEAGQLTALYGEANRQLQLVRDVQEAYGNAHGRLLAAERVVLRRAGVQADALSEDLEAALKDSGTRNQEPGGQVRLEVRDAGQAAGGLPMAGRVERAFGSGQGATRAGVVLHAVAGAQVRATQAARVLYAGPFRHFGGLVILRNVRGENVLLGGFGTLAVKAGDDVAAGQVLGGAGDEGRIYWEVRRGGKVVDPLGRG